MYAIMLIFCATLLISESRYFRESPEAFEENLYQTNEEKSLNSDQILTPWLPDAILDVAYFLRRFKFTGTDERYSNPSNHFTLYKQFPDPPLENIHWQVRRNCEENYEKCLKYIWDSLNEAELSLTRQNNPFRNGQLDEAEFLIKKRNNKECLQHLQDDEKNMQIFRNRLDRFQWLISSSYYMCWFTLQQKPSLQHFNESCDNFASCLNKKDTFTNGDDRANDEKPFACAFHSFCPDPCCANRLLQKGDKGSNCLEPACGGQDGDDADGDGDCAVNFDDNLDWDSMVRNYWNVSCTCPQEGTRWSSQSGLCVDLDECYENSHNCQPPSENCINLPGSFECVCAFGYIPNEDGSCSKDEQLTLIINPQSASLSKTKMEGNNNWFDTYKNWVKKFKQSS